MPDPILLLAALLAVALLLTLTVVAAVAVLRHTEPVRPRSLPDLIGEAPTYSWEHPVLRGDEVVRGPDENEQDFRARLTRQHRPALSKRLAQRGMDDVIVDDCTARRIRGGAA